MTTVLHSNSLVLGVPMSQAMKLAVQAGAALPLARGRCRGQETLNSISHVLLLDCIEGTFRSHDGQYKNPDLAALYSGHIFFPTTFEHFQ